MTPQLNPWERDYTPVAPSASAVPPQAAAPGTMLRVRPISEVQQEIAQFTARPEPAASGGNPWDRDYAPPEPEPPGPGFGQRLYEQTLQAPVELAKGLWNDPRGTLMQTIASMTASQIEAARNPMQLQHGLATPIIEDVRSGNLPGLAGGVTGLALNAFAPKIVSKAPGAVRAAGRGLDTAAEATARRLRQSSLRGGYNVNVPHEEVAGATAAMRGKPLTAEALAQVSAEERALQQQKMKSLAEAELRGATTPRADLLKGLEEVRRQYQEQPLPGRDVKMVDRAIQEVLDTYPEQIPVTRAEAIKEGLVWKEGLPPELQALVASEKNIAETIRGNLLEWSPELAELNKSQQGKIWLMKFMDAAINKRLNSGGFWQRLFTERTLVAGGLAGATTHLFGGPQAGIGATAALMSAVLSDPVIQASLAVGINKAQGLFPTRFGAPNMGAAVARAGKIAQDARIPVERRLPRPEQETLYTPPPRDTSFVRGVPGEYARPEAVPPSRRLPSPDIVTPPPAGYVPEPTSYVRPSGSWGASSRWTPPEEPPPTPPAAPPPVTPPPAPPSAAPPAAAAQTGQREAPMRMGKAPLGNAAEMQRIRNSIAEGEMLLRGKKKATGERFASAELAAIERSVASSKAKLAEHLESAILQERAAQQARFEAEKAAAIEREAAATRPADVGKATPAEAKADFETRKAKRTGKAAPEAPPISDQPQVGKQVEFVALGKKYAGKLEQIDDKGVAHINVDGKITKQDLAAVKPKGWQPPAPTPATTVEFDKERTTSGRKEFTARGADSGEFVTIRGSHGGGYEVEREYYWTPPGESNRYGRTEKLLIGKSGYTKAEAKQVAEAYLKGEPHPLADIEGGLPISQYKPENKAIKFVENRFTGDGFAHAPIEGAEVWTDGHVMFKGKAPGPLSTSAPPRGFEDIWTTAKKGATKDIQPIGFYRAGAGQKIVVFDNNTSLSTQFYDFARKNYPNVTFKGNTPKDAVAVYSNGKMVGIISPMRPDKFPAAIEALLKKK